MDEQSSKLYEMIESAAGILERWKRAYTASECQFSDEIDTCQTILDGALEHLVVSEDADCSNLRAKLDLRQAMIRAQSLSVLVGGVSGGYWSTYSVDDTDDARVDAKAHALRQLALIENTLRSYSVPTGKSEFVRRLLNRHASDIGFNIDMADDGTTIEISLGPSRFPVFATTRVSTALAFINGAKALNCHMAASVKASTTHKEDHQ